MLTSVEKARLQKFTAGMTEIVRNAMEAIFTMTKPGCDSDAYELMYAAHTGNTVGASTIAKYYPHGVVDRFGRVPAPIAAGVRKAVRENYLHMEGPSSPRLSPALKDISYE